LDSDGVPPAFRKKTTLRVCKILYSFSANPITNENPKIHARIEMYKKMHRIIGREQGGLFTRVGIRLIFTTNKGRYVNRACIGYTLFLVQLTGSLVI
ncbi:hypothetical protein CN467_10855, partial [Bacillus cereus]